MRVLLWELVVSLSLRQVEKCFTINKGCETGPPVYCPHFIGFTRVLCACYACLDFVHLFISAVFISCLTVFYLLYINFAQDIFVST